MADSAPDRRYADCDDLLAAEADDAEVYLLEVISETHDELEVISRRVLCGESTSTCGRIGSIAERIDYFRRGLHTSILPAERR